VRELLAPSEFEGQQGYNRTMPAAAVPSPLIRWFLVPLRVLLVTLLLALLSFAVCLFLGILGLLISAAVRGIHPNMTIAYREIAFPAGILAGAAALVAAIVLEIRHHRELRSM
jgi:succinate-acetate transporter protein